MAVTDMTIVSAHEAAEVLRARVSSGEAVSAEALASAEAAERLEALQATARLRHRDDEQAAALGRDREAVRAEWSALNDPSVRAELDQQRAAAVSAAVGYIGSVSQLIAGHRAFVDRAASVGFDVDQRLPDHLRDVLPKLGTAIVAAAGDLLPWQETSPLLDVNTSSVWGAW